MRMSWQYALVGFCGRGRMNGSLDRGVRGDVGTLEQLHWGAACEMRGTLDADPRA